ncbi:unnamed protein product [Bursaphelenchus okinawaensis]|uniref:Elongin-A n=1 Tax=Bursaphelenchus okinawaensis TaxID=465554 RepID=A0A811LLF1_9BILA|nr:unnamed protein product [Bursaphelenchus okinawaensis]CAG9127763.1 unnamed protein product [Bursaphelenchus okinawaensis]
MCNQAIEKVATSASNTAEKSRKRSAGSFEEQLLAADKEVPKKRSKKAKKAAEPAPPSAEEVVKAVEPKFNPLARRANERTRVYSGRPKAGSVETAASPASKYEGWPVEKLEKKWVASPAERPELIKAYKALANKEFKTAEKEADISWRAFYMQLYKEREANLANIARGIKSRQEKIVAETSKTVTVGAINPPSMQSRQRRNGIEPATVRRIPGAAELSQARRRVGEGERRRPTHMAAAMSARTSNVRARDSMARSNNAANGNNGAKKSQPTALMKQALRMMRNRRGR